MLAVPTGFSGMTIDVHNGSTSDEQGDVTKALFAVSYIPTVNDVSVILTDTDGHWSMSTALNEVIGLKNPKTIFNNKDSAIIEFDLDEKYPSNSPVSLCYASPDAKINREELEYSYDFIPNTITGSMGITSNDYGGYTTDDGDVERILFSINYVNRPNNIVFTITDGDDDWLALMGDGSYIKLYEPFILTQTSSSSLVLFKSREKYPSNSVCFLVKGVESAEYTVEEIDESHEYIPVQSITLPSYFPMGDRIYISAYAVVYASNASNRNITWSVKTDGGTGASVDSGWLTTTGPGVLVLNAYVTNGIAIGEDYSQDIQVMVIDNYIVIDQQPHMGNALICGEITESISVIATSITGELEYQWYSSVTNSTSYGTAISGETNYTFNIPKSLISGQYYYFCEVRKSGFPSIRTDVVSIKVRDRLMSLSIFPTTLSIESGNERTLGLTKNPATCDETIPTTWHSNDHMIVGFDQTVDQFTGELLRPGVIKSYAPGNATITAKVGEIETTLPVTVTYTPVTDIELGFGESVRSLVSRTVYEYDSNGNLVCDVNGNPNVLEIITSTITMGYVITTNAYYELPTAPLPYNSTKKTIDWQLCGDDGEYLGDSYISNGKLYTSGNDTFTLKATIVDGLGYPASIDGSTINNNFVKDFRISVITEYVAVENIEFSTSSNFIRVGDINVLQGKIYPTNASYSDITWSITSANDTGSLIQSGNILTATSSGDIRILATVAKGKNAFEDYTQEINITMDPAYQSVEYIDGIPEVIDYGLGTPEKGYQLEAVAMPETANARDIQYSISETSSTKLVPYITDDNVLIFNEQNFTHEDEESIEISISIPNGLGDGVDFVTSASIAISPKLDPGSSFIEAQSYEISIPSVIRAYRPIILDMGSMIPSDATNSTKFWNLSEEDEATKAAAILAMTPVNSKEYYESEGIRFDEEFIWTYPGMYAYPMSSGKMVINAEIYDGLGPSVGSVYQTYNFDVIDPYIPVTDITNIPKEIYTNKPIKLSPILDAGDGNNDQTAVWDDHVPTYTDVKYSIVSSNNIARVEDGYLIASDKGSITLRVTIPSGTQEEWDWQRIDGFDSSYYEVTTDSSGIEIPPIYKEKEFYYTLKSFESIDYTQDFVINIVSSEEKPKDPILRITTSGKDSSEIDVYYAYELNNLCTIDDADSEIVLEDGAISRSSIKEIEFLEEFSYTSLDNFGTNFTNLTTINDIPESVNSLRNFLNGCSSFDQEIIIPDNINGDSCLEGFLQNCTSFNSDVTIPRKISGYKCMENFMRNCTSFNKNIEFPSEVDGKFAMYSAMQGCTKFDSEIILPESVKGERCMENVLRECHAFNKDITLPKKISGKYNIAAFMYDCRNMTMTIHTSDLSEESYYESDVITLASFDRNSEIVKGITVDGPTAESFAENAYDLDPTNVPQRILNVIEG